jgi:histidinol-phosphatase (PHP family)
MPWMVSLHGGHSGEFCEHASGKLKDFITTAIKKGFTTYGVTEHMPRYEDRFLFESEIKKGMTSKDLVRDFENYKIELSKLENEFKNEIILLKGFEVEVASDNYADQVKKIKDQYDFDYIVGSVHFLNNNTIDYSRDSFKNQMEACGGLENYAIMYYKKLTEMISLVKPEVVGHFDLIQKYGKEFGNIETDKIKSEAVKALKLMKNNNSILDINTKLLRMGEDSPYPSSLILKEAKQLSIGCCFGDDSHSPDEVGSSFEKAKKYLLSNGINEITHLSKTGNSVEQKITPLA